MTDRPAPTGGVDENPSHRLGGGGEKLCAVVPLRLSIATGNTGSLSWLTDLTDVTYSEFRDDRFVAAFTDQSAKLAYIVRAVAPGHYALPGSTVEDMYRPERNATLATTTMSVIER